MLFAAIYGCNRREFQHNWIDADDFEFRATFWAGNQLAPNCIIESETSVTLWTYYIFKRYKISKCNP
jgi:hypothetical protein